MIIKKKTWDNNVIFKMSEKSYKKQIKKEAQ